MQNNNIDIQMHAELEFNKPIPSGYVLWSDESFTISIDGTKHNIDFEDVDMSIDKKDRRIVNVYWKTPDTTVFADGFNALTSDALKNSKINFEGNLDNTIIASNPYNDDNRIDIAKISKFEIIAPIELNILN